MSCNNYGSFQSSGFDGFAWPAQFSVAFWLNYHQGGDSNHGVMISNLASDWSSGTFQIDAFYGTGYGHISAGQACPPSKLGQFPCQFSFPYTDDNWMHLGLTYDGQQTQMYLNGNNVASVPNPGTPTTAPTMLYLGDAPESCQMADIRIYSVALTASEMSTLFTAPVVPAALNQSLIAYYDGSDGSNIGANHASEICNTTILVSSLSPAVVNYTIASQLNVSGMGLGASSLQVTVAGIVCLV